MRLSWCKNKHQAYPSANNKIVNAFSRHPEVNTPQCFLCPSSSGALVKYILYYILKMIQIEPSIFT